MEGEPPHAPSSRRHIRRPRRLARVRRERPGRPHHARPQPDPVLGLRLLAGDLVDAVDARSRRHDLRLPGRHRRPHRRHVVTFKFTRARARRSPASSAATTTSCASARCSKRFGVYSLSDSSADTFMRLCLQSSRPRSSSRYVAYNPWPECIMCGRARGHPRRRPGHLARASRRRPARRTPQGRPARRAGRDHHHRRLQVSGSHQRRGAISSCIFCGPYEPARSGAAAADP